MAIKMNEAKTNYQQMVSQVKSGIDIDKKPDTLGMSVWIEKLFPVVKKCSKELEVDPNEIVKAVQGWLNMH